MHSIILDYEFSFHNQDFVVLFTNLFISNNNFWLTILLNSSGTINLIEQKESGHYYSIQTKIPVNLRTDQVI